MRKKKLKFLGIFLVGLVAVSVFSGCISEKNENNDLFSKKLVYDNFSIQSLCVGDINNDGYLDMIQNVVIPSSFDISTGKVIVFINKNGNFEEAWNSDMFAPASLSLGDINDDGSEDIIAGAGQIFTYMNIGNNQFEKAWTSDFREFEVYSIFSGDLNNDGYSDIVYGGNNDLKIHVLINKNGKEFTETWSKDLGELYYAVLTIFLGDVNNDGFKDIICGTDDQRIYVFLNLKNESFSQLWKAELDFPAKSIYLKDLDNNVLKRTKRRPNFLSKTDRSLSFRLKECQISHCPQKKRSKGFSILINLNK